MILPNYSLQASLWVERLWNGLPGISTLLLLRSIFAEEIRQACRFHGFVPNCKKHSELCNTESSTLSIVFSLL